MANETIMEAKKVISLIDDDSMNTDECLDIIREAIIHQNWATVYMWSQELAAYAKIEAQSSQSCLDLIKLFEEN